MVSVLRILKDFCAQEEINKGCGVGKLLPTIDWVLEIWSKQGSFKITNVSAASDSSQTETLHAVLCCSIQKGGTGADKTACIVQKDDNLHNLWNKSGPFQVVCMTHNAKVGTSA